MPYLLLLYVSCKRYMHMHLLFSPNPMKVGLIGMLSASLRFIMIEEHHVICLWKHWYRTICKWISTVLNLYNNLEMRCGSLQLLALTSLSMTRLLRCVFYFCSCRSFQHSAHNLYLSNCTTRSLPLLRRNCAFQLLSLQVDAGSVEPSFAAITTQLKRLGNSNFSTNNVV